MPGVPEDGFARWSFSAPPDTAVANLTAWRAVRVSSASGVARWYLGPSQERLEREIEGCIDYQLPRCTGLGSFAEPEHAASRVDAHGLSAREVHAILECHGFSVGQPCDHPAGAEFKIFRARVGLLDQTTPEIQSDLSGSLTAGAAVEGSAWLTFSVHDQGGGIARVGLMADGHVIQERPTDLSDTHCVQPYVLRVPCPLRATVTLTFDTSALPNGTHVFQTFATDVSGNRVTSAPFTATTRNGSTPNGVGAARAARLTADLTSLDGKPLRGPVSYGRSTVLRGVLTTLEGAPISGATLDVITRVSRPGSAARVRTATTGSDGRYAYRVPGGASRDLEVAYRSFTLDEGYSAAASARVRVRAAIRLNVSRRSLRNGERVRFRGRLLGGPRRQDATLMLYALGGGRPIPVSPVRADAQGRFVYSYRFRTVDQRSTFRFQVRTQNQPAYPYSAGASNVAKVVVRP